MLQKLIMGGFALAVAAAALLLVSIPGATTASAVVNGVSVSPTTINNPAAGGVTTSTRTVDADAGTAVQVLATVGTVTIVSCDGVAAGAAVATCDTVNITGETTANMTIPATEGTSTLIITYTAPSTGPATATVTIVQGTSAKSVNINIRGGASTVETRIMKAASTSTSSCAGSTANVVRSSSATAGNTTGFVCTAVKDSAGNRTPTAPVIYTTDKGTLSAASDITGATGQVANVVTLAAGTTGVSGSEATVTASSSGKITTANLKFGGNASSCSITTNPTTVEVGGSSVVTVTPVDSAAGPIPDAVTVAVVQTNAGAGVNVSILNAAPTTNNGVANTSLIAAIPGAIALGGAIGSTTCTGTVIASGTPVGGGGGTATVSGFAPGAGQSGLTVFSGLATTADAFGLVCGANDAGSSLSMTNASGQTFAYVNGAPAFANAGFMGGVTLGGTQAAFVACA